MNKITILLMLTIIVVVTALSIERKNRNSISDALESTGNVVSRIKRDTEKAKPQAKTTTKTPVKIPAEIPAITTVKTQAKTKVTARPTREYKYIEDIPPNFVSSEETEEQYRTKKKGDKEQRWTCFIHPTLRKFHSSNYDAEREKFFYDQYLAAGSE